MMRFTRRAQQAHVGFFWSAAPFFVVAVHACTHKVLPLVHTTS